MASQDVVVTYRAEVDQLTQELKKVIAAQEAITKEEKEGVKEVQKNATALQTAAKKRLELLKLEEKELVKLKGLRDLAFDPETIKDFDDKISKANKNIALLGGKANQELGGIAGNIKSIGLGIAAGIGAAFTVDAIVQFGKASVNAFLEAESNAQKLKFAITTIAGESEAAFKKLMDQSAQLQGITIFSDDSVQQAQAALAQFGLTSQEIEKLIPKLADFATITSQDIPAAAQQIGAALEGNGREFKKYGIEVSATASRTENLNQILQGLTKFEGAATEATKTLTGGLKQAQNQVGELQESIGEKLAPVLVSIKLAFLDFVDTVITSQAALDKANSLKNLQDDADKAVSALEARAKKIEEVYKVTPNDAYLLALEQEIKLTEQLRDEASKSNLARSAEDYFRASKALDVLNNLLIDFKLNLENQAAAAKVQAARVLSLTQLQKTSTEDLIKLKEKEAVIDDEIAKKNIKNIEDVIKAREAAFQEYKKNIALLRALEIQNQPDPRIQLEAQFGVDVSQITATGKLRNQIIEQLQIELNNKLKLLDEKATAEEKQELQDRQDAFQKSLDEKKKATQDYYNGAQKLLTDAFLQESSKLPEPERRQIAESLEASAREDEAAAIKKIDEDLEADFEDKQNQKVIISAKYTEKIKQIWEALGFDLDAVYESDLKKWLDKNEQILDSSVQLFNALSQLYSTYAQNQVQQIQDKTDAEIEQLDRASEYNQEQLDKRNISEREFANRQKKLEEDKVKAQEAADKKSREIKRKAAILDKAAAIFQIIIDTARAIADVSPVVPLMALAAATGAAQTAIVAAQPIPYKKGTKSAKGGLSQVDEQGSEAILRVREGRLTVLDKGDKVLPAHKTVTYGKVLDTMFDGTFDKHYMKKEMAPRLVKQRELHEKAEKKSFARNISESLVINSQLNTDPIARQLGKGVSISNLDELYNIIDQNRVSPYRR